MGGGVGGWDGVGWDGGLGWGGVGWGVGMEWNGSLPLLFLTVIILLSLYNVCFYVCV